jgi:hypothetical protein
VESRLTSRARSLAFILTWLKYLDFPHKKLESSNRGNSPVPGDATIKRFCMKSTLMLLLIGLSLFAIGCSGADGNDGQVFLAVHMFDGWYSYTDDNPSIPHGLTFGHYYNSDPGTYSYRYRYLNDDGSYREWSGIYSLVPNRGERGRAFWTDGADGADVYLDLYCYYNGPSLSGIHSYPRGMITSTLTEGNLKTPASFTSEILKKTRMSKP